MSVRAIRGAITVENNTRDEILTATKTLLSEMIAANNIVKDDMIGIFFTMTNDLDECYPAVAAREMGYTDIPLVCYAELNIKNSLQKCIRILLQFNTDKENVQLKHIYMKGAKVLRPDLVE